MQHHEDFQDLIAYLKRVPAIDKNIFGSGYFQNGNWWVKFSIDISHALAWHVVQELGYVLNYLSANERLPTVFMPVSPPPSFNGGPSEFLSWVIESSDPSFKPNLAAEWLKDRLPHPVNDLRQWAIDDED